MSRFRLLLLGLLAVFTVGVVSAASASADSCNGGTHLVFCNDANVPLVGETVLGLSSGTLPLLASFLGGAEAKFDCTDFHVTGTIGELGAGTGLLLFLNCKEEKPAGCKLSAANEKEIDAKFISQQETQGLALFTGSGAGEEFTSLSIEGASCIKTGTFTVTGRQMVETPNGGKTEVNQETVAKKAESSLKLGVEKASFSGSAKVHLAGTLNMANLNLAWGVLHGE